MVRDAIIGCFLAAHKEVLDLMKEYGTFKSEEEFKKMKSLNSITHPAIKRKIEEEIAKKSWRGRLVVINAALPELFKGLVDKTVVVSASDQARLARLIKKGFSKSEAQKRMKAQMPMKKYLSIADIVIKNDSAKNNLETEVKELLLS